MNFGPQTAKNRTGVSTDLTRCGSHCTDYTGTDLGPEKLVDGETTASSDQPAVSEFTLNQVITADSVHKQSRIVTDLLHTQSFTHSK